MIGLISSWLYLVEQNLPFALQLADYVYVMSKGRMVYEAAPHLLAQNVEVKAQYLGIQPMMAHRKEYT